MSKLDELLIVRYVSTSPATVTLAYELIVFYEFLFR